MSDERNVPEVDLQWKGTDACLTLWCACGADPHYDGPFAYFVQCPECGTVYELGRTVTATPTSDPEAIASAREMMP